MIAAKKLTSLAADAEAIAMLLNMQGAVESLNDIHRQSSLKDWRPRDAPVIYLPSDDPEDTAESPHFRRILEEKGSIGAPTTPSHCMFGRVYLSTGISMRRIPWRWIAWHWGRWMITAVTIQSQR